MKKTIYVLLCILMLLCVGCEKQLENEPQHSSPTPTPHADYLPLMFDDVEGFLAAIESSISRGATGIEKESKLEEITHFYTLKPIDGATVSNIRVRENYITISYSVEGLSSDPFFGELRIITYRGDGEKVMAGYLKNINPTEKDGYYETTAKNGEENVTGKSYHFLEDNTYLRINVPAGFFEDVEKLDIAKITP